jgi:hypothetical protein
LEWDNEKRVEEMKAGIEGLAGAEFVEIRKWVAERDWKLWDREVQTDSKTGTLDFLIKEAHTTVSSLQESRQVLVSNGGLDHRAPAV